MVCGLASTSSVSCAPELKVRSARNLNKNYETELTRWTRSERIYYNVDRVMYVYITYLSPEFRKAFKDQYLDFFGMPAEKIDTDLEKIATAQAQGYEFFLYADTPENTWNNLDERDSVWRMGLWSGLQPAVDPASVRRFKDRGPNIRSFFPFVNDFGRAYWITFPQNQVEGNPVIVDNSDFWIKVSSALGSAVLSWKVSR